MNIRVESLKAVGPAYARLRRQQGLPPLKSGVSAAPGDEGPVRVLCEGHTYTLWITDSKGRRPAPAAR